MTSPPAAEEAKEPSCFEVLRRALKADALLAATGGKDEKGAATIGETLEAINIPDGFPAGYLPLAPHDVVGMLFAADPRIAERISASQYSDVSAESHTDMAKRLEIQAYLREVGGFEHLVLAGLDSTIYGMAWVVAYRKPSGKAFSDEELEIARYTVPSTLFTFLRDRDKGKGAAGAEAAEAAKTAATGHLVPLNPKWLRIAILEAQGYGPAEIGKKVFLSPGAVSNYLTSIRERLGVGDRNITLRDLEHYAAHTVSKRRSV